MRRVKNSLIKKILHCWDDEFPKRKDRNLSRLVRRRLNRETSKIIRQNR